MRFRSLNQAYSYTVNMRQAISLDVLIEDSLTLSVEEDIGISYYEYNTDVGYFEQKECRDYILVTDETNNWGVDEWYNPYGNSTYVVMGDVYIHSGVLFYGDVKLILTKDSHLTVEGGIYFEGNGYNFPENGSLSICYTEDPHTVLDEANLIVTGDDFSPGIGSMIGNNNSVGIYIHGGNIKATGGDRGSGIGGNGVDVTIWGGYVEATSGASEIGYDWNPEDNAWGIGRDNFGYSGEIRIGSDVYTEYKDQEHKDWFLYQSGWGDNTKQYYDFHEGNYAVRTTYSPISPEIVIHPVPYDGLTYNGENQDLIDKLEYGRANFGHIQFCLEEDLINGEEAWSALSPEKTDAGTYKVCYRAYLNPDKKSETYYVDVTISPRLVTIDGITAENKTYDETTNATILGGEIHDIAVRDKGQLTFTATGEFENPDAGQNKTVKIKNLALQGDAVSNYVLAENGQQTETTANIEPRSIADAVVTLSEDSLKYDGDEKSVSVVSVELDGKTLTTSDYDVTGNTATDVGEHTVTVTGKGNYKDTATAKWRITSDTIIATAENVKLDYDGKGHGIAVIVTTPAEGASIHYGNAEGTYNLDASPTIQDVGTLIVYYQVTAPNYDDYVGSAVVTINKANQEAPEAPTSESCSSDSITLKATDGYEYSKDGQKWQESPTFTGLNPDTSYTFYQRKKEDNNHNASNPSAPATISTTAHKHNWSFTVEGGTITATCSDDDGGHGEDKTAKLSLVAPAHVVYGDGKNAEATVDGSIEGVNTPAIIYNTGDGQAPTKAGNYTASITLGDATASITYEIAPKSIIITGLSVKDKKYNGSTEATIEGTATLREEGYVGAGFIPVALGGALEEGDEVQLEYDTAEFEDAAVGNNKNVTISGLKLTGRDGANYSLDQGTMILKGNITAATSNTHTVTFKVVNGKWNDGRDTDIIVTLTGNEGDELKLDVSQIPTAGNNPDDHFKKGKWDRTPVTNQPIIADTTYIYTYAPEEAETPSDATPTGTITISGLDDTDTLKIYQVISWEPNVGWKLEEPFTDITDLASKMGLANEPISINTDLVNEINSKITAETRTFASGNPSDGTYTTTVPKGMYIAIVTSGKTGTIYNPIIVSADFDKDGSVNAPTSSIPISRSADYGGAQAVAKKENISITKTAQDAISNDKKDGNPVHETVAVGDTITFTITTTLPPYATYLHPSFVITDEMSKGLTYQIGSAEVTVPSGLAKGSKYTVSDESASGYTLSFDEDYLKTIAVNTPVTITYTATVTTDAVNSVNHENNTVALTYSNNPNTATDKGKLKDRTNHYTFTIDGNLLGQTGYEATEVVKVGVDPAGNEITKSTTLSNQGKVGALQGAKFALFSVEDDWTNERAYTNSSDVDFTAITSGSDGRITLKGLDAGKYVLKETHAPAGYIRDTTPVKIEIKANVQPKTYTEDGCTIETDELVSYTVTINGDQTASYTITNSSIATSSSSSKGDTVVGKSDDKGKIKNHQGAELPSTGGAGAKIFYSVGALLMLMGGILIVSKRRAA